MNDLPAPPALRPLAVFTLIALCLSLTPGCQCSWKPDVGPVEDQDSHAARPATPPVAPMKRQEIARPGLT